MTPHLSKLIKAFISYNLKKKYNFFFISCNIFWLFSALPEIAHDSRKVPLSMCYITYTNHSGYPSFILYLWISIIYRRFWQVQQSNLKTNFDYKYVYAKCDFFFKTPHFYQNLNGIKQLSVCLNDSYTYIQSAHMSKCRF